MKKDIDLGKRIAWLRMDHGLKQTEAANSMAIRYTTYQKYEYGNYPSRENIEKILNYYACNKSWLLTGEGDPYPGRPKAYQESSSTPQKKIAYLNPAIRILEESMAEAGVDLNEAQRAALLKIVEEELARTGSKIKEIINVFKKEG